MSNSADLAAFPFNAYYYSGAKCYMIPDLDGTWMPVSEHSLLLHLAKNNFSRRPAKGEELSVAERVALRIQLERNVVYCGPLAGYDAGMVHQFGNKVLVTQSPRYIKAERRPWPTLEKIFNGMFNTGDLNQAQFFHLWLKVADQSFISKKFVPGPLFAMAGAGNTYKTLTSDLVIELLGGRSATPHRYMMERTDFNPELLGSEVLVLDDQYASKDLRQRRVVGALIKNMLYGSFQSCHGKNKTAISLKPFWRMIFIVNDETENLMVLPPIDESLEDKIMLLKVNGFYCGIPSGSDNERAAFWSLLRNELPGYLWWLRNEFTYNGTYPVDKRSGVVPFKHPELLKQISEIGPEERLKALIEAVMFSGPATKEVVISAEEVMRDLTQSDFKFEATKLLSWPNATGSYLGRLAKRYPKRFFRSRDGNDRNWTILSEKEALVRTTQAAN